MTRDVLVRISGLQLIDGEHDDVEVITSGDYFWKNGKHYILYDEVIDGIEESIRNTIKISENRMEVRRPVQRRRFSRSQRGREARRAMRLRWERCSFS